MQHSRIWRPFPNPGRRANKPGSSGMPTPLNGQPAYHSSNFAVGKKKDRHKTIRGLEKNQAPDGFYMQMKYYPRLSSAFLNPAKDPVMVLSGTA